MEVDLSKYDNSWYDPGGRWKRILWYLCSWLFIKTAVPYPSSLKRRMLILFGARVGAGLVIKPNVNIKYPWFLEIGDNVWIGEYAWIDNLCEVKIGSNVCISQGAYILTGNHDYRKPEFDLIIRPVRIASGVWIGAKSVVCPGAVLESHAVLTVGSVAIRTVDAHTIYSGNPATPVKKRDVRSTLPRLHSRTTDHS
jgi:putative colanic acid biosynthesis acetyltransferase WcaF